MQSFITIRDVSFELPNGRTLFNKINITIHSRITALIGPNGVGKTCLAKLIHGDLELTSGSISALGPIVYFPQKETPRPQSVEDYLTGAYSWSILGEKLLSGIDRSVLCTHLSGGQWMRVRLAAAVVDQFLILDEPTNDLDVEAKSILKNFLLQYQQGVLLISHDRDFLSLSDDIIELSNRGIQKYGGVWSSYEEEKERERSNLFAQVDEVKKQRDKAEIERITAIQRQEGRNRRGRKSAEKGGMPKILIGARKRQAEATTGKVDTSTIEKMNRKIHDLHRAMSELKFDPIMYADLAGAQIPNQKLVAEAQDYNVYFERWLYAKPLNFCWRGNIRMAIKGKNGSGKSTLIKAILGKDFPSTGWVQSGNLKTLYIEQGCSILNESLSVIENVQAYAKLSESEIRNGLAKLLFTKEDVFKKVEHLSGGERLRAALACGLLSELAPELLILDEPTNNLDLGNINFLEQLIANFKGAVIAISHDEIFLKNCKIEQELIL